MPRPTRVLPLLLLGFVGCRNVTNYPAYGPCGEGVRVEDVSTSPFAEPPEATYDRIGNFTAQVSWEADDSPLPTTWVHEWIDDAPSDGMPALAAFSSTAQECTNEAVLVTMGRWTQPSTQGPQRLYVTWPDRDGPPVRNVDALVRDPDLVDWATSQVEVPRLETPWGIQLTFNGDTVQMVLRTEEGFVDALPDAFQGTVIYE